MKIKRPGIIVQILIAIAAGVVLGRLLPDGGIRTLATFKSIFSQLVKFLVPLIILGFVTPAIADAGRSAGRLLLITVALAYASTLFAGYFALFAGKAILPPLLGGGLDAAAATAAKTFPPLFKIPIPPIADVISSLVLSFLIGLGIIARSADAVLHVAHQFRDIVSWAISKFFVPLLPVYVMSVIAETMASGRLAVIAGPCVKLMAVCLAFEWTLLAIQYSAAGAIAGRNPFRALVNMLPAYFTGFGCCSSAATIPVTMRQTLKNGVSEETAGLVVPLCANVHLAGSMTNMVVYAAGLMAMAGEPIQLAAFTEFILMISVIAVAAPGVPGGVVLASATVAETALGFTPERYAILIAIYMALDGMSTACNLTGDGALALIADKFKSRPKA
jgi:Na+/H+-dicarboxylate symporter